MAFNYKTIFPMHINYNLQYDDDADENNAEQKANSIFKPRPLLNTQTPPSRPSCILLWRRTGLLSVFIQTPAIALSKISLFSMMPRPLLYTRIPPFCPPQILLLRTSGLLPVLSKSQHFMHTPH